MVIAAMMIDKRFKADNRLMAFFSELEPETEYRKLSLYKIQVFRTLEP